MQVWDVATGRRMFGTDAQGPVFGVVWTPDGQHLVFAGGLLNNSDGYHDDAAYLTDLVGRRSLVTAVHTNTVWSLSISPDGRFLAFASQDRTVVVSPLPASAA